MKTLSKFVNIFTAFVYLFTTVGSSVAQATQTITVMEAVEQENILPTLRLNLQDPVTREAPQDYNRYDLSITPVNGEHRQGVHFRFRSYDSPQDSIEAFINENGPFPHSNVSPLIETDIHTGFVASLPEFGELHCDWQGNIRLVGLHTATPDTLPLALNLATTGTVELSDVTLKNISLKSQTARFLEGVTIQEDSVFDIETLDLADSGFENTNVMRFLSDTHFVSRKHWRNKGVITSNTNYQK